MKGLLTAWTVSSFQVCKQPQCVWVDGLDIHHLLWKTKTAVNRVATRGWFQRQSIPTDPHVKMPNFTAELNMFTAWFITHSFKLYTGFYIIKGVPLEWQVGCRKRRWVYCRLHSACPSSIHASPLCPFLDMKHSSSPRKVSFCHLEVMCACYL